MKLENENGILLNDKKQLEKEKSQLQNAKDQLEIEKDKLQKKRAEYLSNQKELMIENVVLQKLYNATANSGLMKSFGEFAKSVLRKFSFGKIGNNPVPFPDITDIAAIEKEIESLLIDHELDSD